MYVVCSDLEGVFVPEIWINVAKETGIDDLLLTTRDISDYNILMRKRLSILAEHGLRLQDIQRVISRLEPLPGAIDFVDWIRSVTQLIIVSDTFVEFADPLMDQLKRPTLFCHNLATDTDGNITDYILRQNNAKFHVVESLQNLNFKVIAIGDSYNDIEMLRKADHGILFNPPQNIIDENSDLQVVMSYNELKEIISSIVLDGA